ncbi:MAG TPA: hypothetical protein VFW68_12675 [Rhodocyclaceae bacterium]|nr:hypothetical protein [Rhodocyclaceae bacterium]
MKAIFKSALTLVAVFTVLGTAHAEDEGAAPASSGGGEGVVGKVEKAVEHGAKAAANGVEKGVNWAAHGVKKGADATAHGIEVGANATSRVAKKVANKVTGGSSGSSESSESNGKGEAAAGK